MEIVVYKLQRLCKNRQTGYGDYNYAYGGLDTGPWVDKAKPKELFKYFL